MSATSSVASSGVAAPFDAVLCDIDGVLRRWDGAMPALDEANSLAPGTLAEVAFAPERLRSATTGRIVDEEWREAVMLDLAARCGSPERARKVVAEWSAQLGRLDQEVLDLLISVRRSLPVVLISNATTRLESDLAALGVRDHVDAVVNSARVGVVKPDPRIYRFAARRAGVEVDRCLFVDDTPGHVEAARSLGMTGLDYTGIESLRQALAPVLTPDRPQEPV